MNVLIIEDEESAFENLKRILMDIDPSINIMSWLQSVEQSIQWFKRNDFPDLIFLDVQLSDDLSFKIFESVAVSVPIVFTTAFDEYAIKAFEINSIDYILKPISRSSIEKSITKFQSCINQTPHSYNNLIQDLKSFSQNQSYKERFLVNKADELLIIPTADISYFFKENETYIVLKNGDRYAIKFTLDELNLVLNPKQFYRINRQMIVSINAISKITLWFKGKLKLQLIPEYNTTVFVSREGATKFKAWMDK